MVYAALGGREHMQVGIGKLLYRAASGFVGTATIGSATVALSSYLQITFDILLLSWGMVTVWVVWRAVMLASNPLSR